MPKTEEHPMATKHEEITHVLEQAGEEDIKITHLTDKVVIHIKMAPEKKPSEKKGKWARVADELAEENLLRDGLGDELRENARRFRETFVLK
jgi:hypothetical protein